MMNRFEPGLRLTHKASGKSVEIRSDRPYRRDVYLKARRWLSSLVAWKPEDVDRPVRTYSLGESSAIRQGGSALVSGREAVHRTLDGEIMPMLTESRRHSQK
jgi:hypothetical protein